MTNWYVVMNAIRYNQPQIGDGWLRHFCPGCRTESWWQADGREGLRDTVEFMAERHADCRRFL